MHSQPSQPIDSIETVNPEIDANPSPVNLSNSIHQAIIKDLQASKELLNLLEQEQKAMEDRQRDHLANIVNQKADCMNRVDQQATNRYQILQSINREASEGAWKALVLEQNDEGLINDWNSLLSTLQQCQHHNEVNGRLISRGQQTLNQLLTILRGQMNPPELYNQKGAPEARSNTHSVTKA